MVTQSVTIRRSRESDLEHFARFGSRQHVAYCGDEFARGADALTILVAVDEDDVPVGKLHVDFEARGAGDAAVILAAAVKPELQRRGIGSELMREAEALACARGRRTVVVGVEDSNPDARRLYERLGYRECARDDFSYPGAPVPNPASWLQKELEC